MTGVRAVPNAERRAGAALRPVAFGLATLLAVLAAPVEAQVRDLSGPALGSPARTVQAERPATRPVANGDGVKPLPRQILAAPDVEEELEVIERRSQLLVTRSNVVRTAIADASIVDVVQYSPDEIAIIGLERGTTTLTLWFEGSRDPLIYLVRVIRDPGLEDQRRIDYGRLERKLLDLFPNSKVHLIPLSGKIVVKGQARDSEEAARILQIVRGEVINQDGALAGPQPVPGPDAAGLGGAGAFGDAVGFEGRYDLASSLVVNMLEVPGEFQVMLRVRIAELNRQELRRMGVDFSNLFGDGRHFIASALGGVPATLTGIFENGEVDVLLNWLASNGTVKILSEPTMTVLSGHSASFLSGGEFAVPTIVGIGGAQGQTTTFRGFGTSLTATPTVVDRDLIRMRIVPEFSQVNNANAVGGIPGVDSRRVQTTVELREGQTLAIAGLIGRQTNTEVTRIPFLGSIPWIGPTIFSAKRSTEDETELLILVSPEIVRPMEAEEVPPVPGFYVTHPGDHELYRHAPTEGPPDVQQFQLAPFGRGSGHAVPVGYELFEPAPASPAYPPQPTGAHTGTPPYPLSRGGPEPLYGGHAYGPPPPAPPPSPYDGGYRGPRSAPVPQNSPRPSRNPSGPYAPPAPPSPGGHRGPPSVLPPPGAPSARGSSSVRERWVEDSRRSEFDPRRSTIDRAAQTGQVRQTSYARPIRATPASGDRRRYETEPRQPRR